MAAIFAYIPALKMKPNGQPSARVKALFAIGFAALLIAMTLRACGVKL